MKRLLAALVLAGTLAIPAGTAAFTAQEEAAISALCRTYPTTPPPTVRISASQWQSFCRYFR